MKYLIKPNLNENRWVQGTGFYVRKQTASQHMLGFTSLQTVQFKNIKSIGKAAIKLNINHSHLK